MTEISRVSLFGKLNKLGYQAVESATVFCKMRGNPYVEVVHWLHQILNGQDSDIHRIVDHYKLDTGKIATEMTRALDQLPRGATSISDLSEHLLDAMERGWVWGSLLYSSSQVRTGHLLLGMLKTPALRNILTNISPELARIGPDDLADNFRKITDGSPEESLRPQDGSSTGGGAEPGEASGARKAQLGSTEALDQFCTDLTEQARNGDIDPIVGRDEEIRQVIDVLMRRRQNNPILTGEAGVGKTAVVEGFALRIARGDVPPALKDVRLLVLDVGLLQAGANPYAVDAAGKDAIIAASWRGRELVVAFLLEQGIDVETADNSGRTPLAWAAINGYDDIVRELLRVDANPNSVDYRGLTPLMRAAWNGHYKVVKILVRGGADVFLTDREGKTALDRAEEERWPRVVKFLTNHIARIEQN